jgi:uncharacterized membrane protein YesL
MRLSHETYASIFHTVYVGLVSNLLLVVGCAPVVVLLFTTDPARSWPLYALAVPLCAPALVGVFAVLGTLRGGRPDRRLPATDAAGVFTTFGRIWFASWRRATVLATAAVGALVVLAVDIAWAFGQRIGAVLIPVLVVLVLLVFVTAVHGLVVLAERPTVRLREAVRACLYLALRRWYLTGLSLVVLVLLVQIIAARPAIGMGLVAAPLLYVVWANTRFALRPALDPPATSEVPQASASGRRGIDGGASRGRAATARA